MLTHRYVGPFDNLRFQYCLVQNHCLSKSSESVSYMVFYGTIFTWNCLFYQRNATNNFGINEINKMRHNRHQVFCFFAEEISWLTPRFRLPSWNRFVYFCDKSIVRSIWKIRDRFFKCLLSFYGICEVKTFYKLYNFVRFIIIICWLAENHKRFLIFVFFKFFQIWVLRYLFF